MIRTPRARRSAGLGALFLCSALLWPDPAQASPPLPDPEPYRFTSRDALLLLGGAAATAVGRFAIDPHLQDVPPEGLDPDDISLGWDRIALDSPNTDAPTSSDLMLVGGLVSPSAFYLAQGTGELSWDVAGRLWTTQAEAFAVASGVVHLLKSATSRPRPYTYLPDGERPDRAEYDVTVDRAFESFPSGHAASTWAFALSGAAYLAYARPDWSGGAHFADGALAGGFATAAAVLRVDAGQHFPSDVLVGSILGAGIGVGAAVLNRGPDPGVGSREKSLRSCLLGAAAGAAVALLFIPPASPFID